MIINVESLDVVCVAYQIATHYLKKTGQIPTEFDIYQPLFDSIVSDFRAGSRNKLRLANRAIARIEETGYLLELIPRDDDIARTNSNTWVTWDEGGSAARALQGRGRDKATLASGHSSGTKTRTTA